MLLLLWYFRSLFEYRVYFWPWLWRYNVKYWNTVLKQSLHFLDLPQLTYEILNFLLLLALKACFFNIVSCFNICWFLLLALKACCFNIVSCFNICWFLLTHFRPMFIVYNPWKHLKWLTVFLFFLFNWDSLHARLNSQCKVWSYKKKKHKKIKGSWKSV